MVKKILKTGVTNLVGIGMISATAGAVNSLPAGTAKTIAGVIPGLQATSLVGANIPSFEYKKSSSSKVIKSKKSKW